MSEAAFKSAWSGYKCAIEERINGGHHKRWHHRTKNDPLRPQICGLEAAGKHEEAEALRLRDWMTFDVRTHDFRHSYCTMLRDAGVDLKLAMKWLGHADEKMILRVYDHVTDTRIEHAMADVENFVSCSQYGSQNQLHAV